MLRRFLGVLLVMACGQVDVTSDAGTAASSYHDWNDPSLWSTFETTEAYATAEGFYGATFDGQYLYFVPNIYATSYNGLVARYDTKATFASASSWSTFDTSTLTGIPNAFYGAVFDGRYVYLVPQATSVGAPDGVVLRYDSHASFSDKSSWTTFDTTTVNGIASNFIGGVFDGRYVYFAPNNNIKVVIARYDTQADFQSPAAWSTLDISTIAGGFWGAAFDGRYVYLVPNGNTTASKITRYDTQAAFGDLASWSTFDTTTLSPQARGFCGSAFDGRYLYLAPNYFNPTDGGTTGKN